MGGQMVGEDLASSRRTHLWVALVLGFALFCSGFSGLTNEVLWQRSLKRFLGGSETTSSMIVVMVFLGGLGTGAIGMGRIARRARDPLLWLAGLEVLLCLVNLAVCGLLQIDVSQSVFQLQRGAEALGVPLPMLYAFGAAVVLSVPCLLMGATTPLASEVCQRRLGQSDPRVLGLIFFVNTLGAMAGCVLGSTLLVPLWGLAAAMVGAAVLNAGAGGMLLGLRAALPRMASVPESDEPVHPVRRPIWKGSTEEVLALGLGFCALAYEMLLLRVSALIHEPQPATFSMVLCGFLLFWSLGAGLGSRRVRMPLGIGLLLMTGFTAWGATTSLRIVPAELGSAAGMLEFVVTNPLLFTPCMFFGFLFTRVTARAARDWGNDVGRVYGWNTVGACSGILVATFLGYELHLYVAIGVLLALCLCVAAFFFDRERGHRFPILTMCGAGVVFAVLLLPRGFEVDEWGLTEAIDPDGDTRFFFGRSGVVGVSPGGSVYWDGLWHSRLVSGHADAVDTNNWWMAVAPVLAHGTGQIHDVGLIGLGTGVTAATIARLETVNRVDAYEINHTLKHVFEQYPEGTLHAASDPKITIHWQDARSGLALRDRTYDVITTAPLYLRQAGAGILNSRETYELIRSRLKPDGIACVFSWGTDAQAFVVRQTAAQVFAHHVSIWGGYLLLLSDSPIEMDADTLGTRMRRSGSDPLWNEIEAFAGAFSAEGLASVVDTPQFDWGDGRIVTSDDRPIIEYPHYLDRLVEGQGIDVAGIALPSPGEWSYDFDTQKKHLEGGL